MDSRSDMAENFCRSVPPRFVSSGPSLYFLTKLTLSKCMNKLRAFLFGLILHAFPVHAEQVQISVSPGIEATAEYSPGEAAKRAVLLLHGFLQTRDFPTVASLSKGISDAGYTTLAPTLSLGIPNRKQSLACEALHRHTLGEDSGEIGRWVDWLKSHGHHRIIVIGDSFGSLNLLGYLSGKPDPVVDGFIGASVIEVQTDDSQRAVLIASLNRAVRKKDDSLVTAQLSFCKKYVATPPPLLSYMQWDRPRTLAALHAHHKNTRLIMGVSDEWLPANWPKHLKGTGVPLKVVAGASHFIDGEHEFDLMDGALEFLSRIAPAGPSTS